jgi:5-methyltetrahydropteroyltriglutamate--homocysteine methyltransferase
MKRSTDRILTSHTGALHMPEALQERIVARHLGEPHDEQALDEELRAAVAGIVRRQADLGVDVVNDGEFSKSTWMGYVVDRMSGVERVPVDGAPMFSASRDRAEFGRFYAELGDQTFYFEPPELRVLGAAITSEVICSGPIEYTGQAVLQRDIDNLRAGLEGVDVEEVFLPVVGPGSVQPYIRNEHYPDDESRFAALADALRNEYRAIIDAGFICQVDDAFLPWEWDRRLMEENWSLDEYRRWASLAVEALNAALDGLPEDRLRYHICWGSWNGPHVFDVPMKDIIDILLKVNAGAYSFEAANPRHEHEWKVWKDVKLAPGQKLIPGVISHATNVVEHPELVAERLIRFAEIVGRENVMAGTDCGFCQSPLAGRVHQSIMWAKLRSLAEGAAIATKSLWGR